MADDPLRWTEGLFVGQLDADEMKAFEAECKAGRARWSYEGASGFLGLAKVRRAALANPDGRTEEAGKDGV